ncbi:SGNH/GDSL hydrolase family protein [Nocardioides sp. T2.26MG-1]|uniref:SGNH/GDSL hydrolase family protein n=1 Tax=Nocardioides sp. T2.26MG-1 TaxID=3041166 RepID=UPI002477AD14|nr:SGNH/GDSL hydrolase family protein [Nocardioides sp. T2.26MG-1]CAI9411739.1 Lipase 2 [Nocardioides sp. T2.26MG-1]
MRRQLLLLVLGAALLAGCSDGADEPVAAPARTTGSPAAPTQYDRYVALGDSYTAAPLVPPTDVSTVCLRSGVNYPALVAAAMPGTELTDVSCSGAQTANVTTAQTGQRGSTVPPQIRAVRRGTDLVTIGLGGNDEHLFAGVLGQCMELGRTDPTGAPCRAAFADRDLQQTFERIHGNIAGVVRAVQEQAPDARVLVVGYPHIVPASGTCDLLPLAAGDYAFAESVTQGLNDAVRAGATDAGAEYVDLWGISAGHDICADDPWINGRVTSARTALAYHPLAVEQRAVAKAVLERLR